MTQDKILAYIDARIKFLQGDELVSISEMVTNQGIINELIKVRAIVTFKEPKIDLENRNKVLSNMYNQEKKDIEYFLDVDFDNVTEE